MGYELEIEQIDSPEDDFCLTINDTILYLSQREYDALVTGLNEGSIDTTFRKGEEMKVNVYTVSPGIRVEIECGYDDEVKLTLSADEYHAFTSELERYAT